MTVLTSEKSIKGVEFSLREGKIQIIKKLIKEGVKRFDLNLLFRYHMQENFKITMYINDKIIY